jgi:hypothetical protein
MKAEPLRAILLAILLAGASAPAATLYVDAASTNAVSPYTNWLTAAAVIQDAVDAAAPGDEVVVTNGVYAAGGRALAAYSLMTNRVCVDRAITLRSVNGPEVTVIRGYQVPGNIWYGCGDGAIRCVYLGEGAVLNGFTLSNGATLYSLRTYEPDQCGGGIFCESTNALVTNCTLVSNSAQWDGGGACSGTLSKCMLAGNSAAFGGGASFGILNHCMFSGNWAFDNGGGAAVCSLNNCILTGNQAGGDGGGAAYGASTSCTLVGNIASLAGGSLHGRNTNCIIYHNIYLYGAGDAPGGNFCCIKSSSLEGEGNITNEPVFVDLAGGDFRLQSNSPCIDAGINIEASGSTDFEGNPRIARLRVDMGAYEYQGPGLSPFIVWLQQFGLPTDGTADFTDPDGDRLNNYQEYRCGTVPTNALSFLRLLPPARAGVDVTLTWPSVTNRSYLLEWSTDLSATPAFLPLATNLPGQPGTTTFTHTNGAGLVPCFYRVAVP